MTGQKIALVTGGSRGLGKNMALSLASKNVDIILTYNSNREAADDVVSEIRHRGRKAVAIPFNAQNISGFDAFVAQVKDVLNTEWQTERFDFLINNAGIGITVPFAETSEEQFDQLYQIHFKGVYFITQKLLPIVKDGGRIINLATGLTRIVIPGYSAYAAMKGAIETLTKYQAKELGPRKIAVNVVAPGAIETDFNGGSVRDNKQYNDMIASNTALGRVGLPDDIGGVVAFLCSDEAGWITAQRIEVSGGQMI